MTAPTPSPPLPPLTKPYDRHNNRLSLPFPVRLTLLTTLTFSTGVFLGISHGSKTAALRFRAENAHRLPTTPTGWYLYHKSKNYVAVFGGVMEGLKMGTRLGVGAVGFLAVEECLDRWRGERGRDALNTVVAAGVGVGVWGAWRQFPLIMIARTARTGLLFGLVYGLLQDAVGVMKGRRLDYVDFIMRRGRRRERNKEFVL
ncbi:hypothetical protein B7494_g4179 [Chlorociboria aeruginascens]|nr:hypothetical protein B7494_g4179 [Chlorociboria aeruginascens]